MNRWTAELDRVFWDTHWHLLAHRSELATPSRFLRFDVAGQEVVAFHDGEQIQVFDNRCPHRGTRIFDGTDGQQRFLCRYHGWSFAKGRFFIPARETFSCDLSDVRLNGYRTEWLGEFLFVSRRPARPLSEQLEGTAPLLELISRSIGSRADLNHYQYRCNWKIAVENALDQYHVAVIHRGTLDILKMKPMRDEYPGVNSIACADLGDDRLERRLRSLSRFFDLQYQPGGYLAIYLFPFTFVTSTFGYSYSLQQFYPSTDQDRTYFTSRFYRARLSSRAGADTMQSFFESSIDINHKIFAEDEEICARLPTDTWSPEPQRYLSAGEAKVAQFRAVVAATLRGELPRSVPATMPARPADPVLVE